MLTREFEDEKNEEEEERKEEEGEGQTRAGGGRQAPCVGLPWRVGVQWVPQGAVAPGGAGEEEEEERPLAPPPLVPWGEVGRICPCPSQQSTPLSWPESLERGVTLSQSRGISYEIVS